MLKHRQSATQNGFPLQRATPAATLARSLAQGVSIAALSGLTGSAAFAQCAPTPTGVNPATVVCSGTVPAGGAQFTTGAFTGNLNVNVVSGGIIATGVSMNLTDAGNASLTTLTGSSISNSAGNGGSLSSATTGTVTVVSGGTISGATNGLSTTANAGATSLTTNGTVIGGSATGVGISATTTKGNVAIGGTGTIQGGAGIVVNANPSSVGGIDSGSVTILRSGAVTGQAAVTNPTPPYVGSNGDGIYVVTNGGAINIGSMTSVTGTANGIWARTGGTGNTTQVVNAGTLQVHDIGTISSAGGIDSALRGWGGGGVTVQNIGTITGGLDGIHMTAIGTPAVSAFLAQTITSITAQTRSGIQATATGDLTVKQVGNVSAVVDGIVLTSIINSGPVPPAGTITVDTIGAVTTATTASGGTGILLSAQHGSATVNNVAGIQSHLDGVNATATGSVAVTNSTANIASQTASGLLLSAGTGITVSLNQGISGVNGGINAQSTSGLVNILQNKVISSQTGNGIFAKANAGDVTIQKNTGITGGQSAVIAQASGAVLIDTNTTLSSTSNVGVFASGTTVAYTNNGPTTGGTDGVTLSGVTSVNVSANGPIAANSGTGLNASASNGGVTIQNNGTITGTAVGMSAGGSGAVLISGNGNITGSAGDGINAYNVPGGTPGITIQNNADIHGNTNGINAGTAGSISIIGNGKIDGHAGVGMTLNVGGGVTLQNNRVISGSTEGAFIQAGGPVLVSGNTNIFGGILNGITVITTGSATFANNGPIFGNISGINISAGTNVLITSTNSITGLTAGGINATSTAGSIQVDQSLGSIIGTNSGITTTATAAGATSSLTNQATGYVQAATAFNVTSGTGTATINNGGTLNGSQFAIQGQSGGGAFNINNTGTLAGAVVVTGANTATSTFANAGTFKLGGAVSSFTGNYTQAATGSLAVDANWTAATSGRLNVTGTANLAGTVLVNPINFPTTSGLNKQFTILHANGGITNNGISAANTAAVTYALLTPNANDLVVSATINIQGASANQSSVAGALNSVVASGGTSQLTTAILKAPTASALNSALSQLSPGGTQQAQQNTQFAGAFNNAMLSCSVNGEGVSIIAEGQCLWVRAKTVHTAVDASASRPGFTEQMEQITAGAQLALATHWRAGLALGYDQSSNISDNTRTSSERVAVGGVLKYTDGPWLLAASISGGWGRYDRSRQIAFGDFNAVATSASDAEYLASRLHAAYLFDLGGIYVKPLIDAGVTRSIRQGFREHGGNGAGLNVAASATNSWSASPAVEIGTQLHVGDYAWRPFIKVGATFINPADTIVSASFVDAPSASFQTRARYDSALFDGGAGLALLNKEGAALRLQYDGKFGPTSEQHSFTVKGSLPF